MSEQVEQADRDEAVKLLRGLHYVTYREVRSIEAGEQDHSSAVQAFARHRLASQLPVLSLLEQARDALSKTLDHYWLNVCVHEETHRGGYLWTICNGCDTKWADDRGGFVPFVEPEEITRATALLAKLPKRSVDA